MKFHYLYDQSNTIYAKLHNRSTKHFAWEKGHLGFLIQVNWLNQRGNNGLQYKTIQYNDLQYKAIFNLNWISQNIMIQR